MCPPIVLSSFLEDDLRPDGSVYPSTRVPHTATPRQRGSTDQENCALAEYAFDTFTFPRVNSDEVRWRTLQATEDNVGEEGVRHNHKQESVGLRYSASIHLLT